MSYFFFNDTATTEIYTLSLHDALPISAAAPAIGEQRQADAAVGLLDRRHHLVAHVGDAGVEVAEGAADAGGSGVHATSRSEEHTSELQSRQYLVCRLLLEKKKKRPKYR